MKSEIFSTNGPAGPHLPSSPSPSRERPQRRLCLAAWWLLVVLAITGAVAAGLGGRRRSDEADRGARAAAGRRWDAGRATVAATPGVAATRGEAGRGDGVELARRRAAVEAELQALRTQRRSLPLAAMEWVAWVHRLDGGDLRLALESVGKFPPERDMLDAVDTLLICRLAEADGEEAQVIMNSLPGGRRVSRGASRALFETWLKNDPVGALDGLERQRLQEGPGFEEVVEKTIESVSEEFPALAEAAAVRRAQAERDPASEHGSEALVALMTRRVKQDRDYGAAVAWFDGLAVSPAQRQRLWHDLLAQAIDHEAAAVGTVLPRVDLSADPELAGRMIAALSGSAPEQAGRLAAALPPGQARAAGATALVRALMDGGQAEAAAAWLGAQTSGRDFDDSRAEVARSLRSSDPAGAWQLSAGIADSAQRERLTALAAIAWLDADRSGATQALPPEWVAKYDAALRGLQEVRTALPEALLTMPER